MRGLSGSRWATQSRPGPAATHRHHTSPAHISPAHISPAASNHTNNGPNGQNGHDRVKSPTEELRLYTQIVRRLRWKLPLLAVGYAKAVDRSSGSSAAEAEVMFKLDFFEFYMLLERALVHLQGVFGIVIDRNAGSTANGNGTGTANHRWHANVLAALDHRDNPLHEVLGLGDVRRQLARAKALRNRWKNADDDYIDGDGEQLQEKQAQGAMGAALETYDLEGILSTIFDGFDSAFHVAQRYVFDAMADIHATALDAVAAPEPMQDLDDSDGGWAFMTDAMDWQAV